MALHLVTDIVSLSFKEQSILSNLQSSSQIGKNIEHETYNFQLWKTLIFLYKMSTYSVNQLLCR